MHYTRLGSSGLKVSRIGLGMMSYGDPAVLSWSLSEDAAEPLVRGAVEAGVTFFDTADMYSDGASEKVTGRLPGRFFARRSDYVLASKVYYPTGPGPNDRGTVAGAHHRRRRRVAAPARDRPHRPVPGASVGSRDAGGGDHERAARPGAGRQGALRRRVPDAHLAVRQGTTAARAGGWTPFVSMQTRYNLAYREEEREMLPCCLDQGVGVIPYSPLAGEGGGACRPHRGWCGRPAAGVSGRR